jgi:hypothetical protein
MAFYLNGSLITWCSHKEKTVALLSCEAKFMAATATIMQAMWLRNLLSELTGTKPKVVTMFVDSMGAANTLISSIIISKNVLSMDRSLSRG